MGTSVLLAVLQIKSVDYKYRDGQSVQSTRLPGYSGVSGLDDYDEEAREHADLESVRCDLCCPSGLPCTDGAEKKKKGTTPFGVSLTGSLVVYRAALRCRIRFNGKVMLSNACCGICAAMRSRLWVDFMLCQVCHALICRHQDTQALHYALPQAILAVQMFVNDMQDRAEGSLTISQSCLQVQCQCKIRGLIAICL